MWLGLLGPFCVQHDGAPALVPAAKQRAVLAVLAARAGQVLSFGELAEAIWDGTPPAAARTTLRAYVMRLRQALGPELAARVVTREPGYLLDAAADEVDLLAFDRLCGQGAAAVQAGTWELAWQVLGRALGLWRGEPLADIGCDSLRRDLLPRLETQRLQAIEWRIDAGLVLGRHEELVPDLTGMVGVHPLRERFCAQLMLALYRCGRQGEALAAYQRIRRQLVDQLGVEPGPELRDLQRRILSGDPSLCRPAPEATARPPASPAARPAVPAVAVPRQLPAAVTGFVGRPAELAELDRLAADGSGGVGAVVITAIGGTAGVGKTALAVHWAHQVARRFPDGQLYVNLRGFDPGGQVMEPAAAVRGFLDALGVPAERIPADLDAQAALYRSLLASRQVLVLLDNARDAEGVRPLLPGTATALAVVTSRNSLTGLVAADGAYPLALDLLTHEEARELLARRIDPGRIAAEPQAVEQIIGACARLPLALALVAARAATHPAFPLTALATELVQAGGRTGRLDAGDVLAQVRAVFSWSYTTLTPAAARLFRLLGLHPGPDTSAAAAASLTAAPVPDTRRLLVELARAGLLTEYAPGRYGFHDLLRAYAADLAVDADEERRAATTRLLDHYTHTAHTAARLLYPARNPIQLPLAPPVTGVTPEQPTDLRTALAWLAAEHPVLLAAQRLAAGSGHDTHVWQLAWALDKFLDRRGHWHDLAGAWQTALAAADRLGNLTATAYAHRGLAHAGSLLGDYGEALTHLGHALDLFTEAGDLTGQAHTHIVLAMLWERQDRPDRALGHAQQALDLFRAAGQRRGQADALNSVGWCHILLGDHTRGLTHCQQALAVYQQAGDRGGEAATWDSLGYAHHHLNHHTQAIDCYQHALALRRDFGDRYQEAATLIHLGDTHHAAGHPDHARTAWTAALTILTDLDHPDTDTVHAKLTTLDQTPLDRPDINPAPS